jgi:hypothetical protein
MTTNAPISARVLYPGKVLALFFRVCIMLALFVGSNSRPLSQRLVAFEGNTEI